MTRQIINVGTADKGNGDPIRTAFIKANANFAELYNILSNNTGGSIITTDVIGSVFADDSTLLVDGINGSIPYSVLSGAPTIPAAQVQSNWTASSGMGVILNKPTLFSGSYTDLTSKPTLFSGSYTDLTSKPTIPTLVSQLANDSGFLTSVSNISNIRSEGNVNIDINLSDSTLRRWQFGEDGILTLPSVGKINNGAYDWTFGSTGITTFPGVINAGNINNLVVNDLGGGTSLTAGSQVQIGNSAGIAGAGVIIKNAVTNTLGGEISLESGSKIQMDNGNVSLFGYTYNSIDGIDGLENQLVVEVDNSYLNKVVRIGTRIINTIEGSTTNVFQGVTISQYGNITFPDNTVQSTAWTGFSVAADDSTQRSISSGELVKFIGAGGVTTASDAEGNITITGSKVIGSWTVTNGTSTYSFTLPSDGTYVMWVKGNIANGIITWNATASVTNTNVPAIGSQYAWNYTGGGSPILLTAIPDQIRGSAGTISTDSTYAGSTSNRFDFGISNTTGSSQTVYYGYTKIS